MGEQGDHPLEVENHEQLPELLVGVFDSNGNRTGPARGERWVVKAECEGLIDEAAAASAAAAAAEAAEPGSTASSEGGKKRKQQKAGGGTKERARQVDSEGKCTFLGLKVGREVGTRAPPTSSHPPTSRLQAGLI